MSVALLLLLVYLTGTSLGQPAPPTPTPVPDLATPPKVRVSQNLKGLTIESLPLFRVAGNEQMTAKDRVEMVRLRVQHLVELSNTDPPAVRVDRVAGATVVRSGQHILITVTNEDIPEFDLSLQPPEIRQKLEEEVAEHWRSALEKEINLAVTMRTPAYRNLAWSVVFALLLATLGLHRLINWVGRKHLHSPLWSAKFLLWTGSLYIALRLFPYSRNWANLVYQSFLYPYLLLLLVILATRVASQLAERMVSRYFFALQQSQELVHLSRLGQRLATLDQAARVTVRVLLMIVGGFSYLVLLKIDLGAILTGAGVVGVTIGLATQDLLKNVLAGVNILLEDHFGIGDVIEVESIMGTVEAFHLRCTQVRTVDGRLVTIPNNNLNVVQNHSNGWGRVDFRVEVAYKENLGRALDILMEEATKLSEDWEDQITEPPVMMGVETLGENGTTLRLLLRTIPLSQWSVKRELNRRVKDRFDQESIEIPFPQRALWERAPRVVEPVTTTP
jgi:moderate conductance mechanosensitive channel